MNKNNKKVVILTGNINTGKSAALMEWILNKNVCGFITPTINHKKEFYHISQQKYYPYQVTTVEADTLQVGNYILSSKAFNLAKNIAETAIRKKCTLFVVDEVGKLELNNIGHYGLVKQLLQHFDGIILLVVRQQLVRSVILHFNIHEYTVLTKDQLMHYHV